MPKSEKQWYIYVLKDPRTGEVRYVGRTVDVRKRFREHVLRCSQARTLKDLWVGELIGIGLQPIIEVLESGQGQRYDVAEVEWVAYYRMAGASLVNETEGGDGVRGLTVTEATRAKLRAWKRRPDSDTTKQKKSESQRRRWECAEITDEYRAKLADNARGRKATAETRAKITEAVRNPSAETRAKLSEAGKRRAPMSTEWRLKLSEAAKNASPEVKAKRYGPKVFTAEGRARISATHKGKPSAWSGRKASAETRAKMSAAQKRRQEKLKSEGLKSAGGVATSPPALEVRPQQAPDSSIPLIKP